MARASSFRIPFRAPWCARASVAAYFYPQYNAFLPGRLDRTLRCKEGYIKPGDVAQTGKPGYIRSVGMAARNIEECREHGQHRAEQRQEHAASGIAFTAQRASGPARSAPDPELKMDGIDAQSMTHKWFSCTVATTPGQHTPTSFYMVLRR